MAVLILAGGTILLTLLDLLCKYLAETSFEKNEERPVAGGKILLRRVHNKGMALNMGDDDPEMVKKISVFMLLGVICTQMFNMMRKGRYLLKTGLAFLTAGAASNTFDRCVKGYVVDYIGFRTGNKKTTAITYNLGDFFIAAGAVFMVLSSIVRDLKRKK